MHWLSRQPAFGKSREFEITTRAVGRDAMETAGDIEEEEDDKEQFSHGMSLTRSNFESSSDKLEIPLDRKKKKVVFMPCFGSCLLPSPWGVQ
jgi:hypothetical protein